MAATAILISAKLARSKHFAGKGQEAHLLLSAFKRYYIVVDISYMTTDE